MFILGNKHLKINSDVENTPKMCIGKISRFLIFFNSVSNLWNLWALILPVLAVDLASF
jgi:hypothetical protein